MPSIQHEAVIQILHRDPQVAAMLLGLCRVELPSGSVSVVATATCPSYATATLGSSAQSSPGKHATLWRN